MSYIELDFILDTDEDGVHTTTPAIMVDGVEQSGRGGCINTTIYFLSINEGEE